MSLRRIRGPLARRRAAVAALLGSLAPFVHAQATPAAAAPERSAQQFERVVVTGVRTPTPVDRLAADVVVIDAEAIRTSLADSVEDLLRREAGVQLSRNGGPGQSAAVLLRGGFASNTVVFVDGVRIGSATLGQVAFESLSLTQVERIEVLRGPGSSLYGADAVGGVVQIFTRRGRGPLQFNAHAAAGGLGSHEASVGATGTQGAFDYAVSAAHEGSDGVSAVRPGDLLGNYNPDRDGYTRARGSARLGFRPAEGQRIGVQWMQSRLDAQYDSSEFLPPGFAQDATPDFRGRSTTRVASVDHEARWSEAWSTTVRLAHGEDDLVSGGTATDRFRTRRDQFELQATWAYDGDNRLTAAFEHLAEKAQSTSYAADVKRDNDALVLAWLGRVGAWKLQADVRHDRNSVWGSENTGRLGAKLDLGGGLQLRALAGTTFRAPGFNELYFPGYGVPTIRPERGRSLEAGLDWRTAGGDLSLTVYRNRVRDLIGYESDRSLCPADPSFDFGCARNIGRARLQGASLAGGTRIGALALRGGVEFLDAIDADSGERLRRRAAHQATVDATWNAGPWQFGASVLRVGARPDAGATLPRETTLDLVARWQLAAAWQLEARLLNATDRELQPARDYNGLPRRAWLGVRYDGGK